MLIVVCGIRFVLFDCLLFEVSDQYLRPTATRRGGEPWRCSLAGKRGSAKGVVIVRVRVRVRVRLRVGVIVIVIVIIIIIRRRVVGIVIVGVLIVKSLSRSLLAELQVSSTK